MAKLRTKAPRVDPLGFGKGSRQQRLPNRHALNTLTKGDPVQRSLNNYARQTPSGAGALDAPSLIPAWSPFA